MEELETFEGQELSAIIIHSLLSNREEKVTLLWKHVIPDMGEGKKGGVLSIGFLHVTPDKADMDEGKREACWELIS